MQDREIVAAVVAGDPAGLAAAYDRYAAPLHAYCRSLLAEPADAADAVQDTFVIAAAKLGELRDRDRLRPWRYAVARNECHRRLRGRARLASLEEAGEVTDTAADQPAAAADRAGLRDLVTAAVAGLNPGDREVIELNLGHDLDGADLADALGVPLNQAHALASRARGQLERSLGALLVARTGRASCAELASILAGWDGSLTVLLRKRVSRHIESCEICGERRRRELSPAMLFSVLPLVALPAGLRHQVLRLVSDVSPDTARYRALVAGRAGPFGAAGFPVQLSPAGTGRRLRVRPHAGSYAAAAAVLVLAAGASAAAVRLGHEHDAADRRGAAATVTVTAAAAVSVSVAVPSPHPRHAAARASGTTPAPSATSAPPTSAPAGTASPSPAASPPPTPPPATLEASTTIVRLPSSAPYTGTFTLTAAGGPVTYSIAVPAAEQAYLSLTPAAGTLRSGHAQVITVTVTLTPGGPPPAFYNTVTADPGAITITVYYPPSG